MRHPIVYYTKKVFKNKNFNNTSNIFKFCTDRLSTKIDNVDDSRVK